MKLHFKTEELADRRRRTIKALQDEGLDGLLIFRQESMFYLTGYDTIGFVFFQCLYLGADGTMFLLTRRPDELQAKQTSVIENIHIWQDGDGVNPSLDLRNLLIEYNQQGKRLGIEREAYGLTGANSELLNASLAGLVSLVDASFLVSRLRVVKSKAEQNYVRKAGELADAALQAALDLAEPSISEAKIMADMQSAVLKRDGDFSGCNFVVGSGPQAQLVRYHAGRRNLEERDQLTIEYAGVFRHYHAVALHTIMIGEPTKEHLDRFAACKEAVLACEDVLTPGRSLADVYTAGAKTLDKAGYGEDRFSAFGYSLGACFAPNWMDWPMLHSANRLEIKSGMVFFVHVVLPNPVTGVTQSLGRTSIVGSKGVEPVCSNSLELFLR